jgi:5-oxoprolinase (ATP-hydrolysing) subunit C
MSLVVRHSGLQSLLVDFGRERSRSLGVPVGGAADRAALALGNALVGNAPSAPALEVAFAGPVVEALHPTACVIFGAPFQSSVNGVPISPGVTFTLEAGDVLRVGGTSRGARAYLCVAGGFDVPEVLGSRSALEPMRAGDALNCAASRTEPRGLPFAWVEEPTPSLKGRGEKPLSNSTTFNEAQDATSSITPLPFREGEPGGVGFLRCLDGPQSDWFTDNSFFAQQYEVAAASNRMGLRLKGAPLARKPGELLSEAVAPGAVQITNDGLPVILGVDGQTIGGYPKVAHVIRADLDALAQLRPGDSVRFRRVSPEGAEAATHERALFLREWLTRLRIAERQPVFV